MLKQKFHIHANTSNYPKGAHFDPVNINRPDLAILKASGCEYLVWCDFPPGWEIRRIGTSEPVHLDMFFMESGTLELEYEEGCFLAGPGELCMIPSWVDRHVHIPEATRHLYVRFGNYKAFPQIKSPQIRKTTLLIPLKFYFMQLLFHSIDIINDTEYHAGVASLIHLLLRQELTGGTSPNRIVAGEMLRHLQRTGIFSVALLAKEFGMSLSALRNFSLDNFHKTPHALIEEVRTSRAKGLLLCHELTIEDIADQLGFSNRFSFSKTFKNMTGISPCAFRNNPHAK